MQCLIILPLATFQDDLQQHGSPHQRSLQRAIAGPGASLLRRQRLRRRGDLRGGELEISLEPPGLLKGGDTTRWGPGNLLLVDDIWWLFVEGYPNFLEILGIYLSPNHWGYPMILPRKISNEYPWNPVSKSNELYLESKNLVGYPMILPCWIPSGHLT